MGGCVGLDIDVRAARAGDVPAISQFIAALPDAHSFTHATARHVAAYWVAPEQPTDHSGVLAQDGEGRVIGHAAYIRLYGPRAELALHVPDAAAPTQLGATLVETLAELAHANGIRRFVISRRAGAALGDFLLTRRPNWTAKAIEFATVPG